LHLIVLESHMPKCTRESRRGGNIFDSSATATPLIVSKVVQKHEYLLQPERSPAVPVLDPYRHPLAQFVGLVSVRWGKASLDRQVVETIERIEPEASREVRLLGSCWSWRALTSATIVVWADQPFGQAGTRPRLRAKKGNWKARSEMRRNHRRDFKGSGCGLC
jgi:hypothetical protein